MQHNILSLKDYRWKNVNFSLVFECATGSPVVISVPHDCAFSSSDMFGLFERRKAGDTCRDKHVWPIAKDILLKVKVNAVRGLFPRSFIDYNRSPEGINYYPLSREAASTAYDDDSLRSIYDSYHQVIANLLMSTIARYGEEKCLLIDLHGFTTQPSYGEYDIILGTGNRVTINHSDIDKSLADFFSARGYRVFLPLEATVGPVEDQYSADFTTRHYAERFGVNAIQIEVNRKFRTSEGVENGRRLSADLADFFRLNFEV